MPEGRGGGTAYGLSLCTPVRLGRGGGEGRTVEGKGERERGGHWLQCPARGLLSIGSLRCVSPDCPEKSWLTGKGRPVAAPKTTWSLGGAGHRKG